MEILLNKCNWQLKGYWPNVPLLGKSMELGNELMGVTEWIEATVPGGVHFDLIRAGIIEDPYYELNSLKCEWVEHRWWLYKTTFSVDGNLEGLSLTLVFKGVDYKAYFYLNGQKLGEHEGMYEHVKFEISSLIRYDGENELSVLLEHAPWEMSQIGYTSKTCTQKSRFNYKWDFSTRLVNIGIWDDVLVKVRDRIRLEDIYVRPSVVNGKGSVMVSSAILGEAGDACTVKAVVYYEDALVCEIQKEVLVGAENFRFSACMDISYAKLWYPNGDGEQPLYKVKITVYHEGKISDEYEQFTGIRSAEYRQNEGSSEDSLPYTFVINGKPIYIKGVNLTPLDHLYGNVTKETYIKYIRLIKNANINLVRVWGGGIIEKEFFYHLCDSNGIMIWQEFIQPSSGIDNTPSTDVRFLELLKATATQAVKDRRNHVSHMVWSGGNELMDEDGRPVSYSHLNIAMLKDIVETYDPGKLFLPSSASGPNEFLNIEKPGSNHDVHGSWKYEGVKQHYNMYNMSDSLLHSEFGVDGCSSTVCLKGFLGKENLKITNMKENLVWRHHGEWWDTFERDSAIFGGFESIEQFVKASQYMQAEGLRYALEANRRRKFRNSGSIVWQFNEPWPNVSCTSLVDYYSIPKMAYYWMQKAYAPAHVSLKYHSLVYKPFSEFLSEIFIHNSLNSGEFNITWEILNVRGNVICNGKHNKSICGNTSQRIEYIKTIVPSLECDVFFVRLRAYDSLGREVSDNLYMFSQREDSHFKPVLNLGEGNLKIEKKSSGYVIKNIGRTVCLFVYGRVQSPEVSIMINNNYSTLFPGEERIFNISTANAERDIDVNCVDVKWDYLNS